MLVRDGKTTMIEDGDEDPPTPPSHSCSMWTLNFSSAGGLSAARPPWWRKSRRAKGTWWTTPALWQERGRPTFDMRKKKNRFSLHCTCLRGSVCVCAALPWQTIPSQKWDVRWTVLWSCTGLLLVNFFSSSCVLLKRPWWGQLIWPWPTALIINIKIYIYMENIYLFWGKTLAKMKWCLF